MKNPQPIFWRRINSTSNALAKPCLEWPDFAAGHHAVDNLHIGRSVKSICLSDWFTAQMRARALSSCSSSRELNMAMFPTRFVFRYFLEPVLVRRQFVMLQTVQQLYEIGGIFFLRGEALRELS